MKYFLAVVLVFLGLSGSCRADGQFSLSGLVDSASSEVRTIWNEGATEAYLPLYTYHLRFAYDANKIASYNENPWGIGIGKGIKDDNGNWHGLYAMEFQDSHNRFEPIAGYGFIHPMANFAGVNLGIGYTVFLTARSDINHYIPFPGVLPLASIEKGSVSVKAAYIPGKHNNGNVLFFFGTYRFAQ
ncbi:MAG: lipid IV(A) palmitoyltransferase PagP [Formivibrio sp.]|nr:lipid IV(A) palmitoyltransferase PagP [Formivibrio sp.]